MHQIRHSTWLVGTSHGITNGIDEVKDSYRNEWGKLQTLSSADRPVATITMFVSTCEETTGTLI